MLRGRNKNTHHLDYSTNLDKKLSPMKAVTEGDDPDAREAQNESANPIGEA
jgi:hypothetical protein